MLRAVGLFVVVALALLCALQPPIAHAYEDRPHAYYGRPNPPNGYDGPARPAAAQYGQAAPPAYYPNQQRQPRPPRNRGADGDTPHLVVLLLTVVLALALGNLIDPNRFTLSLPMLPLASLFRGLQTVLSALSGPWIVNDKLGQFVSFLCIWAVFTGVMKAVYADDDDHRQETRAAAAAMHHAEGMRPYGHAMQRPPQDNALVLPSKMIVLVAILFFLIAGRGSETMIRSAFSQLLVLVNLGLVVLWLAEYREGLPIRGLLHLMAFACAGYPMGNLCLLLGAAYGVFNAARIVNRIMDPVDY